MVSRSETLSVLIPFVTLLTLFTLGLYTLAHHAGLADKFTYFLFGSFTASATGIEIIRRSSYTPLLYGVGATGLLIALAGASLTFAALVSGFISSFAAFWIMYLILGFLEDRKESSEK
jgi:prepilin signal peptidase PulO-like enzyme (type II secretory pathway)